MTRRHIPGPVPAEQAERDSDPVHSFRIESALAHAEEREIDQMLCDPDWWFDLLEGLVANHVAAEALANAYKNYGSNAELRKSLCALFEYAGEIARDELEG